MVGTVDRAVPAFFETPAYARNLRNYLLDVRVRDAQLTVDCETDKHNGGILLLGAGRMGSALLRGWIASKRFPTIHVVEPAPSEAIRALAGKRNIMLSSNFEAERVKLQAAVLTLKPQVLKNETALLKTVGAANVLVVSIAAGIDTDFLRNALGSASVVRTMPNTPGAIGRGITALYAPETTSKADRVLAESLMVALGETVWIADEALMDVITALSGSGPAYIFLLTEMMTKAGIVQGLPPNVATRLARATIAGAGALLETDLRTPEELRRDVTSPGGTTEAAFKVLMGENELESLMFRAIAAATRRSKELGRRSEERDSAL
jgi:pyrroline-5-carboxylate reductase